MTAEPWEASMLSLHQAGRRLWRTTLPAIRESMVVQQPWHGFQVSRCLTVDGRTRVQVKAVTPLMVLLRLGSCLMDLSPTRTVHLLSSTRIQCPRSARRGR